MDAFIVFWLILFSPFEPIKSNRLNELVEFCGDVYCDEISDQYWALMQWFYKDRNRLSVHLIAPSNAGNWNFERKTVILKELTQSKYCELIGFFLIFEFL